MVLGGGRSYGFGGGGHMVLGGRKRDSVVANKV